jgi:hypothetical protein
MPAEVKKEIQLEIAHLLFIDIVAYSKLSVNKQYVRIEELKLPLSQGFSGRTIFITDAHPSEGLAFRSASG